MVQHCDFRRGRVISLGRAVCQPDFLSPSGPGAYALGLDDGTSISDGPWAPIETSEAM
jgi:hypothetical protein